MKVIIGLGNPDQKYQQTRHNVGHLLIDLFPEVEGFKKFKTNTYMNQSGSFVKRIIRQENISLKDLVIVHDDWAFGVGEYKLSFNRNANRHNGVLDIINQLGTKAFWRIRIGIGDCPEGIESSDYVLTKFTKSELEKIQGLAVNISELVQTIK